jgi:fatty-acyl-CoA synthase
MRQEEHLAPREANFRPLTPLDFLERSVAVHPDRPAVILHDRRYTYREFGDLVGRFAAMPSNEDKARVLAHQGVRHITASRVRVVDQQGNDIASDGATVGEIVLQGNTLMAGYYGDEAATEAAFSGGQFHTGDLAVCHPDGYIEIKDRSKDIIISGGENISSLEVESVLHQHPAVLLAAIVAVPDEKWDETPCAVIELKDGMTAMPEELTDFCRARLAGFKVPRKFVFEPIPKTATGKVQKFQLCAELRASNRS